MKSTKRSLLLSALSLILCVTMLLGTTFAWFTDTVSSGKNQIVAGNLDVELYANGAQVTTETKLFDAVELWEPGAAAYETLQVKNVGNLALKYRLSLLFENETKVGGHGLSEVLKIGFFEGPVASGAKREDVIAQVGATTWQSLATFTKNGKLEGGEDDAVTYVIWWEPGDNDNLFNMNNDNKGKELSIDFWVKLEATQLASESDSFGPDYDKAAWLPWTGEEVSSEDFAENVKADEKLVEIWQPEELAYWAKHATDYENYTVKLMSDVDLNGKTWTPVNGWNGALNGVTLDGNGHAIKNMVTYADTDAGFIVRNASSVTVKDLTFVNAEVSTKANKNQSYAGVLMGKNYSTLTVENVDLKNCTVNNNWQCGGLIGYSEGTVTFKKCDVEDSEFGGLNATAGTLFGLGQVDVNVENCTAKNVTLYTDSLTYASTAKNDNSFWVGHLYTHQLTKTGTNTETDVKIVYYVAEGIVLSNDGSTYSILNATGLVNFAKMVNSKKSTFAGKTVKLENDIDLAGINWTPIGGDTMADYPSIAFAGTFDGQDHTISNLTCSSNAPKYACAGLFGALSDSEGAPVATVKNVKLENVDITSTHYAGAVVAYASNKGKVENCHVKGGSVTSECELVGSKYDNGDKVGGINGYGVSVITGCSVEGLTITGYRDIGGIAGCVDGATVTNNTVKDVVLVNNRLHDYKGADYGTDDAKYDVNAIIGEKLNTVTDENNVHTNVKINYIKAVQKGADATATQNNVTAAVAAAGAGDTVILPNTEAGVKLPNVASGVTVKGDGTTVIDAIGSGSIAKVDGTLEGLVINCGQSNYHGFQHSDVTLKSCTINGLLISYGTMVFEDCTFNQTVVEYNMWAYGSVTYKNCTFNTCGKAVNVYSEGPTVQYKVVFDGCTFNNMDNLAKKPAVLIKSNGSNPAAYRYDVVINNCTTNGNWPTNYLADEASAQIGNNPLYDIEKDGKDIKLTVDGVQIYPAN